MNESKATRYQRLRRRVRAASLLSGATMLAALALTPAGRWLSALAEATAGPAPAVVRAPLSLGTFVLAAVVLWELAVLPAAWFLTPRAERSRGGEVPDWRLALTAQARVAALTFVAALAAGAAVQAGAWLAGPRWWALTGFLLALVLVGALGVAPSLVARASGVRALDRPALIERLGALARRVRVPIASIDALSAADAPGATALVTGLGGSRRVFISSDLLRDWTDEEIAVVVAHEMAHHAHHDLWVTALMDAAVIAAGLWGSDRALGAWGEALGVHGPADLAALPLIALVAGGVWLVATPMRHALSRYQERRADAFALALTGGAEPFMAAVRRLSAQHLAEERPSAVTRWLYHRHPSVSERLAMAEAFRRSR